MLTDLEFKYGGVISRYHLNVCKWSWDYGISQVGKDWRSLQSKLLLKAGSALGLDHVAQDFTLLGLENLQGQILHNLTRQPVPLLACPHREKIFYFCPAQTSVVSNYTNLVSTLLLPLPDNDLEQDRCHIVPIQYCTCYWLPTQYNPLAANYPISVLPI